jgi:hypothetical protein
MDNEPALTPAIIFSDSAIRDRVTGKLTLAGIFQRFQSPQIPFTSPPFFVTVFVTNIGGKIESLPVTMNIEDSGGRIISTSTGHISSASQVAGNHVPEIAFPLPPTKFKVAGQYKAVVLVAGERLGCRVLSVTSLYDSGNL